VAGFRFFNACPKRSNVSLADLLLPVEAVDVDVDVDVDVNVGVNLGGVGANVDVDVDVDIDENVEFVK